MSLLSSDPDAAAAGPRLLPELSEVVSYAAYQNEVPVLADLRIENDTDAELNGLTLTMARTPELIRPRSWTIDRVFAKLKQALRRASAWDHDALIEAAVAAMKSITPADIRGCMRHAGDVDAA